jgi:Protein of unknown function (DUF732)
MRVVIGTLAILFCLCSPARAHADASQAAYVHALQQAGIPGTSDQMLNNGYVMCEALNSHQDVLTVATVSVQHSGLPVTQTAYEVGAAIKWLCPQQSWQIKELHDADPAVPGVTAAISGYGG